MGVDEGGGASSKHRDASVESTATPAPSEFELGMDVDDIMDSIFGDWAKSFAQSVSPSPRATTTSAASLPKDVLETSPSNGSTSQRDAVDSPVASALVCSERA